MVHSVWLTSHGAIYLNILRYVLFICRNNVVSRTATSEYTLQGLSRNMYRMGFREDFNLAVKTGLYDLGLLNA